MIPSSNSAWRPLNDRQEEGSIDYDEPDWVGVPCRGQEAPQRALAEKYVNPGSLPQH
jgi:hypothetical protein